MPSEAVIRTGKRSVVIVAQGDGTFRARRRRDRASKPTARPKSARDFAAGQKVVVSGQFLIDSEANLKAR